MKDQGLRNLPVPPLKESIARHVRSLRPLLGDAEFARVERLAEECVRDGSGAWRLQELLEQRAKERRNWLEEWWLKYAYLGYPDPITVSSNYFVLFDEEFSPVGAKPTRIAAWHIEGMLEFHRMILDNTLPVETMGRKKIPLCMDQFNRLLNTTRIPGEKCDSHRVEQHHRHIVVISRRQYYRLDVDGMTIAEIEAQLDRIQAHSKQQDIADDCAVGYLTGTSRPRWARARAEMLRSGVNKRTLDEIETCCFVVVLDESYPRTTTEGARALLTGDASNRFYDKVIELVVFANGRAGMNGEHSPIDAISTVSMTNHMMRTRKFENPFGPPADAMALPAPILLPFDLSSNVRRLIAEAKQEWVPHEAELEFGTLHFDRFGHTYVQQCRLSPDAFIQMGIQLAYYKLYKTGVATYETAQTRMYHHGRTETVRTLSVETANFTKIMEDQNASDMAKLKCFETALTSHLKQMGDCTVGKGVDRHLMGLRLIAMEHNLPLPDLLKDPSYALATTWILTTSNVNPTPGFFGGYGPPGSKNGYGCCYCTTTDSLRFSIGAHASCPDTSVDKFKQALAESLTQLGKLAQLRRKILQEKEKEKKGKSKL